MPINKEKSDTLSAAEIGEMLSSLPTKIQRLLDKCVGTKPFYVPDYLTFKIEASSILEPIFQYCDGVFHSTGELPEFFELSLQIFSEKKAEYESKLQQMTTPANEKDIKGQMDIFMRLKLLPSFFGYTEPSPDNILTMFDIKFKLRNEQNPQKRQELLESYILVAEGTSSHQFYCAMQAKEEGKLEKALEFCNKAIQIFPGNTPAYILKREILLELAKKTVDDGLEQEPRDEALKFIRDLDENIRNLRLQFAKGCINADDLVIQVEHSIEEQIQYNKFVLSRYIERVNRILFNKNSIDSRCEFIII